MIASYVERNLMPYFAPINGVPHHRIGWGNSGDLTEYSVKNPLPDVNTPVYRQELIGGLT